MAKVPVLGDGHRGALAELTSVSDSDVVDCDPGLGDCVMYARLEGIRFDTFVLLGWDHAVTRGALAIVSERSVLSRSLSAPTLSPTR